MKTNEEIIEELEKDFPFLFEAMEEVTIFGTPFKKRFKDYLFEALQAKDEQARLEKIEMLEYIKKEYGHFMDGCNGCELEFLDTEIEEDEKLIF